ncbi:hypothetical protein ACQP3F_31260, partial [Escherichia coli]
RTSIKGIVEFSTLILTIVAKSLISKVFFMLFYPVVCQLKPKISLVLFLHMRELVANSLHATVKKRVWAFE